MNEYLFIKWLLELSNQEDLRPEELLQRYRQEIQGC